MCKEKFDLEKEVENFKKIIRKEFKEKYIDSSQVEVTEDMVIEALYAGYLDTCRTIKWNDKTEKNRKSIVEQIFKDSDVVNQIKEFMKNGIQGKEDKDRQNKFDEMHFKLCTAMKGKFEKECIAFTHGQAQKIINMAFKYLYCIDIKDIGKERFKNCHMPLDSFTLDWIYRAYLKHPQNLQGIEIGKGISVRGQKKNIKKDAVGKWSSMLYKDNLPDTGDKCTYEFYLSLLRKKFKNECLLEKDFYIWPRMQKILSAEAFIKIFNDDDNDPSPNTDDYNYQIDDLEATLQNKLDSVKDKCKR